MSHAIAHIESRHRHIVDGKVITSHAGARGVFQLMPATARDLGVNPDNLRENIRGGIRYFSQRLKLADGDVDKAVAMYYAGIGNVERRGALQWEGVQRYIRNFRALIEQAQPVTQAPLDINLDFWIYIIIGVLVLAIILEVIL